MLLVCYFIVFLFVSCLFFSPQLTKHTYLRGEEETIFITKATTTTKHTQFKDKKNKYVNKI